MTDKVEAVERMLDRYDYLRQQCSQSYYGDVGDRAITRKTLDKLGNTVVVSFRIGDFLDFVSEQTGVDSNYMIVRLDNGPFNHTRGNSPSFLSKYQLIHPAGVSYLNVSIEGYPSMPQHSLVTFPDGTIGNSTWWGLKPIRSKEELFENEKPVFQMRVASLFDFCELQADDRPLLEHCRTTHSSMDMSDSNSPDYFHRTQLVFESDPVDVYLHVPVKSLAFERERGSVTYDMISSFIEKEQEKEGQKVKEKA